MSALMIVIAFGSGFGSPTAAQGIMAVRWLAGCWEREGARSVTLEMWMPPAGGVMLGASRTVAGGTVRATERLMLREEGAGLVYVAEPSGQTETAFTSTEVIDGGFTVENPTHDFPQRILYRRLSDDSLLARIEGPGPAGPRGVDFPMRRVPCAP